MNRMMTAAIVLVIATGTIGCSSDGDGGSRSSARSGSSSSSRGSSSGSRSSNGDEVPFLDPDAPAVYNRIRDARIMLYQPQNATVMIMVNNGHSKRRTTNGQLQLCNNRADVGYMPLSDRQIDALLESMKERNAALVREPWSSRHDRLLRARKGEVERFRGIIVVENDGGREAYVGWRPQGPNDVAGQERYRVFTELKLLIAGWGSGYVERPGVVNIGLTDPGSLNSRPPRR